MKRLWKRMVCLVHGHYPWQPRLIVNGSWKFIAWTSPDGEKAEVHICARCHRFYGDID